MSIRALIVDDEPLARRTIRRFLKDHLDICVLEECSDGISAVGAILDKRPDLVFLDVQMPELDGFGVVNGVGIRQMPATIFVTAFDHYALAAFDSNAIDYLLKPIEKSRFARALDRVRKQLSRGDEQDVARRLLQTMKRMDERNNYLERWPVTENGRIVFLKTQDIQWIGAQGNYVRLHISTRQYDVHETITSLEARLNPRTFIRIHRSTIVNINHVKELHPWFHGYHLVRLENGQELRMSRYQREMAERLGLPRRTK